MTIDDSESTIAVAMGGDRPESDEELIESANRQARGRSPARAGVPSEREGSLTPEQAFEALYLRYRDWVYRLAWRFTGNREDALDVLQETFAYLLGKFPGPADRQARFKLTAAMTTFLYPVVKHLAVATRRERGPGCSGLRSQASRAQRGTQPGGASPTLPDELAAPESRAPGGSRADLAAVLAALPEDQREVVLMRFVDSMSLQEIAGALDIPLGTVKSRLHNALNTLRTDRRTRDYFLE